MGTPYTDVYESFLDKVKEDAEFFIYQGTTVQDSQMLILKQCKKYLNEACTRIRIRLSEYHRNFTHRDNVTELFELELNEFEIEAIALVMFEKHVSKGLAEYKAVTSFFYDADLAQLNPTTERKEFNNYVNGIIYKNNCYIDELESKDADFKMKFPNYSNPI